MTDRKRTTNDRLTDRIERLIRKNRKLGDWKMGDEAPAGAEMKDAAEFGAALVALKGELANGSASMANIAVRCSLAELILQTVDIERKAGATWH